MVVVRVVVVRVLLLQTQNFLSPAGRDSSTNAKFSVQRRVVLVRVVVVRTQNFLSPAARGSGSRGSGARVSGTKPKFSKSSRAW